VCVSLNAPGGYEHGHGGERAGDWLYGGWGRGPGAVGRSDNGRQADSQGCSGRQYSTFQTRAYRNPWPQVYEKQVEVLQEQLMKVGA
jgi:hypothetical protein